MLEHAPLAHCVLFSDLAKAKAGDLVEIMGDEAHHAARVKRVRPGERIGLIDARGRFGTGALSAVTGSRSKPVLQIQLELCELCPQPQPVIDVYAALPKGDRLDRMIDQLTQLGVTRFRPLLCEHAQRKTDTVRPDKLDRIVIEAMKQCRRCWPLVIDDPIVLEDAVRDPDAIIADATGPIWETTRDATTRRVLIVGPEGGWSNTERALFVETNASVRRFGIFVMRIEAAAAAAASLAMCVNDCEYGS